MSPHQLIIEVKKLSDPEKIKIQQWFFKTKKGEYGYGSKFLGLTMPQCHSMARKYSSMKLNEIQQILKSEYHTLRMIALLMLIDKYKIGTAQEKEKIFSIYLKNTKYINNWDLVDVSCYKIVGDYLLDHPREILYKLAASSDLWKKRISIISTYAFIKQNQFEDTLALAKFLVNDKHDLIHKAVGWMLREVGNRNKKDEIKFLNIYAPIMPRTMLRYAIEKFPESQRKKFLAVKHS